MRPTRRFPGQPLTLLESAARTADVTSDLHAGVPATYEGVLVVVDVTAVSGTGPTLTVNVQDDDGSGVTTRLSSASISSVGTTLLLVHPEAPDRANVSENTSLNYKWRVSAVVGGTTPSFTYSVTAFCLS